MKVYAIDPGPEQSALVVFDGQTVVSHLTLPNGEMLAELAAGRNIGDHVLVIEQVASFGMPVGAEVFETVFWSGRFAQAWSGLVPLMGWDRVKRHEVKTALCAHPRAKDPHIRQALIDRFGPGRDRAIGRKATPGPLYGLVADEWSALAVAVTYWDRQTAMARAI